MGNSVGGDLAANNGLVNQGYANSEYAAYEPVDQVKSLPHSLFYEAITADQPLDGLFNYYSPGAKSGVSFKTYTESETSEKINEIIPAESRNPTANKIIETIMTSKGPGGEKPYLSPNSVYRGQPYNVKDFIFCKDYGKIPNNRMLTLRRFPHPVEDHLSISNEWAIENSERITSLEKSDAPNLYLQQLLNHIGQPVAQCVGYFGDGTGNQLSSILKVTNGLNWRTFKQDQKTENTPNDPGIVNSFWGQLIEASLGTEAKGLFGNASDLFSNFTEEGVQNKELAFDRILFDKLYTVDGPLSKKLWVDVNTVDNVMTREVGFSGGNEAIELSFTYDLTSVATINSRLLFMDLYTNLLSIGTDYGKFLVPEHRQKTATQGLGFPGGPAGYAEFLTKPVEYVKKILAGSYTEDVKKKLGTGFEQIKLLQKQIKNIDFSNPESYKDIIDNPVVYKLLENSLRMKALDEVVTKPIVLTGAATGNWHLVVGNPLNPIAMIGNLICNKVEITFSDDLGPDDFPTSMTAKYSLQPARQRHRGDYESMFNRGRGRFYLGKLTTQDQNLNVYKMQDGKTLSDIDKNVQKNGLASAVQGVTTNPNQ